MDSKTSNYVPGVCNINTAEVDQRRRAGYIMLGITLACVAAMFTLDALLNLSAGIRIVLFLPIFITAVCFLQVRYHFCVNYGSRGLQNTTEGDEIAQEIVDKAAKKMDLRRTRKIQWQAGAAAALITLVLIALPV